MPPASVGHSNVGFFEPTPGCWNPGYLTLPRESVMLAMLTQHQDIVMYAVLTYTRILYVGYFHPT
jgi:hypothetical protein